ncbi:lytic murein transglycosylase [Lentilitoribacter sp. EG35]|uniref:lytic murein transglycosylase n=1 Tax=Lentilitoribacter sp. EG35 TaxID=3234192 RepID=UPI0034608EF3
MTKIQFSIFVFLLCFLPLHAGAQSLDKQFATWAQTDLKRATKSAGISNRTFKRAMSGVQLDLKLPGLTLPGAKQKKQKQTQAEFRSPANYFNEKRMQGLASIGNSLLVKHQKTLQRIEQKYGVPAGIILAIWGRESGYGRASIPHSVVRVLATRAFLSDRREFFQKELIAAMKIIQSGDVSAAKMKSSWAGAMGQPQFMPSSYLQFAVDFDGDGKRNIWSSTPDALASIANYLKQSGWQSNRDWGFEVSLPADANCAREGPDMAKPIKSWAQEGILRISGRPFPTLEMSQAGMLILPAGIWGPEFIVTPNFYVIKKYNNSDNYALFIGNLADRIGFGMGSFKTKWANQKVMYRSDIRKIQQRLEMQGYDVGGADGLPGYKTRRSIGDWQQKKRIKQTCFPSQNLLKKMGL